MSEVSRDVSGASDEPRRDGTDWARPVVHFELRALEPERQRAFYAGMFNWDIGDGPIMTIPAGIGGPEPGPAGHILQAGAAGVSLYIQVRDLEASIERAVALGGQAVGAPFPVPNGPTIATIVDPEGNRVTLVQQ